MKNGKIKNINLLYVILVFIISTIMIKINSTLWINVFEVMITVYFTIIYAIINGNFEFFIFRFSKNLFPYILQSYMLLLMDIYKMI